jgi:hypothetical protein
MDLNSIVSDFRKKVCEKLDLSSEGINRYRVFTPFLFDDGDHLSIVLKKENNSWILTDEGHTYMHLTYEIDEKDFHSGTRQTLISNALSVFSVDDREGELIIKIENDKYGDALYNLIQALLKITDVKYLSRERVLSTFIADFKLFIIDLVPEYRRQFDWHDPARDPDGKYLVDCLINNIPKPIVTFALQNDDQTRDATITLLQFEKWGLPFKSMAIFEDQVQINRKVLARFSDVCEKQFSSLGANQDRIKKFINESISNQ